MILPNTNVFNHVGISNLNSSIFSEESINLHISSKEYILLTLCPKKPYPKKEVDKLPVRPDADLYQSQKSDQLEKLSVGINRGKENIITSIFIRGKEDGLKAIHLRNWKIPYEAIIQALQIKVTNLANGELELRSPGLVKKINSQVFTRDPELGLVLSIAEIENIFGVSAKFDLEEYAIVFDVPWSGRSAFSKASQLPQVSVEGLPLMTAPKQTFTAIEQRARLAKQTKNQLAIQNDLTAVGTIAGGSWFVQFNQPNASRFGNWRLNQAQFLRQTQESDYIVGSQSPFWPARETGNFWGVTSIYRRKFQAASDTVGSLDSQQRLSASELGKTISGEAKPGTLVRLVQGLGEDTDSEILAETLVDASGVYRFENVKGYSLRLLLYAQGRLTKPPEIREVDLGSVIGQIPSGASATIVSGGFLRQSPETNRRTGQSIMLQGGIARRWGASQDLTLGLGAVYNQSFQGLGEIFWRPRSFPLEATVSTALGNRWSLNTNFRIKPSQNLYFNLSGNHDSNHNFAYRINGNWQVNPHFSVFGNYNSLGSTATIGGQVNFSSKNRFTFLRAAIDTNRKLTWSWFQRFGNVELDHQTSNGTSLSELSYSLVTDPLSQSEQRILFNYETSYSANERNSLASLGWRYRSSELTADGYNRWEIQLSYGVGSKGSGLIASVGAKVLPGLSVRGRYQGISTTSNTSSLSLELISNWNVQYGMRLGDRYFQNLRTQGGMTIVPFFDENQNGRYDSHEALYLDNPNLLLTLNSKSLESFSPTIGRDRVSLSLPSGTYRLDFDPAGFPVDYQTTADALGVQVTAGSYTFIPVPLVRAYSITGMVTDTINQLLPGAKVEVISTRNRKRLGGFTNSAGIYNLERLEQGEYILEVNGKPVKKISLQKMSPSVQEINLKLNTIDIIDLL